MTTTKHAERDELEPHARELVRQFMEDHVPFNRFLGMWLGDARRGYGKLLLPFRDELVGDPFKPALHGGVISALADTVGGCAIFTAIEPGMRCSTIDLRVDYLRPGKLEALVAEATVLRFGGRVVVASIQVHHGDASAPIAVAMGVYSVRKLS